MNNCTTLHTTRKLQRHFLGNLNDRNDLSLLERKTIKNNTNKKKHQPNNQERIGWEIMSIHLFTFQYETKPSIEKMYVFSVFWFLNEWYTDCHPSLPGTRKVYLWFCSWQKTTTLRHDTLTLMHLNRRKFSRKFLTLTLPLTWDLRLV